MRWASFLRPFAPLGFLIGKNFQAHATLQNLGPILRLNTVLPHGHFPQAIILEDTGNLAFLVGLREGREPIPVFPKGYFNMGNFALPSLTTQPVSGGNNDLTQYQRSLTNNIGTAGQNLLTQGTGQVGQALSYWGPILSGNRAEMSAALAPEINTINSGYNQQRQQLDTFAPRGGGRANLMQQLPFNQTRDISTLFSGLRPQAANAVAGIGENQQSTGSNMLAQAVQAVLQKMGLNVQQSGQAMALGGALAGPFATLGSNVLGAGIAQAFPGLTKTPGT